MFYLQKYSEFFYSFKTTIAGFKGTSAHWKVRMGPKGCEGQIMSQIADDVRPKQIEDLQPDAPLPPPIATSVPYLSESTHDLDSSIFFADGHFPNIEAFLDIPSTSLISNTNLPIIPKKWTLLKQKDSDFWDLIIELDGGEWGRVFVMSYGFYPPGPGWTAT